MAKKVQDALKDIISLCKRRGFIFPGSEIYDGLANTWDYGPYGVELKRNIKNLWWKKFVTLVYLLGKKFYKHILTMKPKFISMGIILI